MSLLIKISALLIILTGILAAQDCTSRVSVETNRESAAIYINNEFAGKGTAVKELEKGKYTIIVAEDSVTWNAETFSDSFEIADCNDAKNFVYSFKGQLYLQSDPPDSYVFSNDSLIGYTPLYLTTSMTTLRLSKPGFADVILNPGEINGSSTIKLNRIGEEEGELFYQTFIFKFFVASAIALGAVTAYYKLKADDYFLEYQFSGEPELLLKTKRYDQISGVSFAALQVNFALLFYFLLTD